MSGRQAISSTNLGSSRARALLALAIVVAGIQLPATTDAEDTEAIRVAVASSFFHTASDLAATFEHRHNIRLVLISGSTGKHYAQIVNGAPFDLFFAADALRPMRLEEQGFAVTGTRITYALGRLVLWSPRSDWKELGEAALRERDFNRLAIANPKLAPFGAAAHQVLEALDLWDELSPSIVRAENVGQAMHYVVSRGADLGFVSLSQIRDASGAPSAGTYWRVPQELYDPIEQQAVLLVNERGARQFLSFVASPAGQAIIQQHGYGIP